MRHVTWIAMGWLVLSAACLRTEPEPEAPTGQAAPEPEYELMTHWQPSVSVVAFKDYVDDPFEYVGTMVVVEATVDAVVSERVFWVNGDGDDRALAVVREDVPRHQMREVNVGDRVRFNALVLPSSARSAVVGELGAAARSAIASTPAFLAVYWADVTILERG